MKIIDNPKIKTSELIAQLRSKFNVYSYWNDEELDKNFPPPKKKTTRYFKDDVEADDEYKNMSADELDEKGIQGITLRERLIMELQYFNETGNHLDIENITLCSGSRNSDGNVPSVDWDTGNREVYVGYYGPDRSDPCLRARTASLVPLNLETDNPSLESRVQALEDFKRKVEEILVIK